MGIRQQRRSGSCIRRRHAVPPGGDFLKIHILAYGKAGRCAEADLTDRYLKRMLWPVRLVELAESAPLPPPPPGATEILLDERGEAMASAGFASMLERLRDGGCRDLNFLIGPADGHLAATRARAARAISFGPATWPHLMVRAMLAEQLYRAQAILSGHPYHRA